MLCYVLYNCAAATDAFIIYEARKSVLETLFASISRLMICIHVKGMGFDRSAVIAALQRNNNNVESAANMLLR